MKHTISIVTGNPGKVRELKAMAMGKLNFVMEDLDLPEIQSLDLQEIVEHKLQQAYERIQGPVIVDDVSAGLKSLKGLPGPFIKFFNHTLGGDALLQLSNVPDDEVTIRCIAAYYDGKQHIFGIGEIKGKVVEPRGSNGFGFDPIVIPNGQTKTMGEMTNEEKMQISHRGKAFRDLLTKLGA